MSQRTAPTISGIRRPTAWKRLAAALTVVISVLGIGSPAFADPAGPTDYESEVLSIEPPTPSITVEILGGDSFVELTARPGTEVVLDGYDAEPYLWFRPDGTVFENRASRTAYLNESRYGSDVPPEVAADAEPDWVQVGDAGRYAWHDHRAHWMQPIRPAGKRPGDQIVEAAIPMVVDGDDVLVTVASTWLPEPSRVPLAVGALAGLAVAGVGLGLGLLRRRSEWTLAVLPLTALTLTVGWLQYRSLPAETGPRLVWWALPAIAVVSAAVAAVLARRDRFVASAAALIAGTQLAIWGWIKRDGLTAAIIPTDAPGWLDRSVTLAALVGGVGVTVVALWELFDRPRELPATV
jgi:hypothetical protein